MSYINSKEKYKYFINVEKSKYNISSNIKSAIFALFGSENNIIWKIQKRLRKTEYFLNTNKKFRYYFSLIKYRRLSIKYQINIPLNTIDVGLKIMHLGPILINGNARIGKNFTIHINTGIVAKGVGVDLVPNIGNDVVLGISSVICGNIEIGDGIAIGANSFVNKSFLETNITIAGNPAKKVSDGGKEKWNNTNL